MNAPAAPKRPMRRIALAVVALALAALAGGGWWALHSEAVLAALLARATAATGGRLAIEGPAGTLAGPLGAARVRWTDADVAIDAQDVSLDWALAPLLSGTLKVSPVHIGRLDVAVAPSDAPLSLPASLRLPLKLSLPRVAVDTLVVREPGAEPGVALDGLRASLDFDGRAYRIEHLVFAHALGGVSARGTLAGDAPFAVALEAQLATTVLDEPTGIDVRASGDLSSLALDAASELRGASLSARASLAPTAQRPLSAVEARITGLDLAAFLPGAPATRIDASVEASAIADRPVRAGERLVPMSGSLSLRNLEPGTIDQQRLPVETATARFALEQGRLQFSALDLAGPPGRLAGEAQLLADGGFDLRVSTEALDLQRVHAQLLSTRLAGSLRVRPRGEALAFEARFADRELTLQADATLAADVLAIADASVTVRGGSGRFRGDVQVAAPYRFNLAGSVSKLDPSRFIDLPPGSLNGAWQASGQAQPHPVATAGVTLTDSRWLGQPLSGRLEARLEARPDRPRVSDARLSARLGASEIAANGALGADGDRLAFRFASTALRELDPRLEGRASVEGELRDRLQWPSLQASVKGENLSFEGRLRAASLQARLALPSRVDGPFDVSARAAGLRVQDRALDAAALDARGSLAQHEVAASVRAGATGIDATARAEGRLVLDPAGRLTPDTRWRWEGRLLEAAQAGKPALQLTAPAQVALAPDLLEVRDARVRVDGADGAAVALAQARWDGGRLAVRGTAGRIPLRWVQALLPPQALSAAASDALRLGARWDVAGTVGPGGSLDGQVAVFRESGDVQIEVSGPEGGPEVVTAGLDRVDAQLDFAGNALNATVDVRGARLGTIRANGRTTLKWPSQGLRPDLDVPLAGTVDLDMPSLAWTRTLTGEAWQFGGSLQARLAIGGTLGAPRATGRFAGSKLVADQREFGMRLTDGELRATLTENALTVESLSFRSGRGTVTMTGSLRPNEDERSEAILRLDRLPIPLGPGQRLVLSGEASASLIRGELRLRGTLRADEGAIELKASTTSALGDDIVVVRRAGEAPIRGAAVSRVTREAAAVTAGPAADGFRISSNVSIDLGDRFRVFGSGVDARLTGQVALRGRLPDSPALFGTVRIAQGTYSNFGQKLEIERGTLVFSGPVDNPAIDIVAYRRFLPVEAGVALTGTAQVPQLTLVSRPDVPEQEKLSWLVLGVGADTSRDRGESAALQAAAASLLAARGSPLAGNSLASTFGLDVVSIRTDQVGSQAQPGGGGTTSSSAQDSIITLGKRLTNDLFISYEQSLRGLQNLFRIQYELTERLSVRLRAGTENALDLLWTYRYD